MREDVDRVFGVKYRVIVIYRPNQDTLRMKGSITVITQGCRHKPRLQAS